MRIESRLSWLAVAAGSALCASAAAVGADARWLAALGGTIARAGRIPSSIPYAAAPSHDWVNVPVLGELVFHWLEALGGDRGLVAAQAIAVAATLTLVLRDMRAAGASDGARALVIVGIPFAAVSALFVVRAQLLSLPFFALLVLLLRAEARRASLRVWLIVPLVALWSNLHGAVLVGLLVVTAYLLLERIKRDRWLALGVLAGAWGALFATPALARTGDYYLGVLHGEPAASGFGLWATLSLRNPLDVLFVAAQALRADVTHRERGTEPRRQKIFRAGVQPVPRYQRKLATLAHGLRAEPARAACGRRPRPARSARSGRPGAPCDPWPWAAPRRARSPPRRPHGRPRAATGPTQRLP